MSRISNVIFYMTLMTVNNSVTVKRLITYIHVEPCKASRDAHAIFFIIENYSSQVFIDLKHRHTEEGLSEGSEHRIFQVLTSPVS